MTEPAQTEQTPASTPGPNQQLGAPSAKGGRRALKILLRLAVSIGLLSYLILTIDLGSLKTVWREFNLFWFIGAFAITLAGLPVTALRWRLLLKARGIDCTLIQAIRLHLIGAFFNAFLPSTVGGDVVRAYHLSSSSGKKADSFVSVVLERALGVVALTMIATVAATIYYDKIRETGAVMAIAVMWIGVITAAIFFYTSDRWLKRLTVLLNPAPGRKLDKFLRKAGSLQQSVEGFSRLRSQILAGLGLSLLFQLLIPLAGWALARALGAQINIEYFFVFGPIQTCILMIPISIQGIGLREASSIYFYTQAGMTRAQALAFGIGGYVMITTTSLIGGILFLFWKKQAARRDDNVEP